jgi:hypothetical protein
MDTDTTVLQSFGEQIHQDFILEYSDVFLGIEKTLLQFKPIDRAKLKASLDTLVKSEMPNSKLLEFWDNTGANIGIGEESIRDFYREIISIIEKIEKK